MKTPLPRSAAPGLAPFVRRVGLFLLPAILGVVVLLVIPLSRSFAWFFVRGDSASHGQWVHARVCTSPDPIDVAFLGTSRVMCAVADERIEEALRAAGRKLHVASLGYPRHGRNLNYVIARELLEARPVRHLFIEVGVNEHSRSHALFGYVASRDALLGAPVVADIDYPRDLYRGLLARLDQARRAVLGLTPPAPPQSSHVHYETVGTPDGLASPNILDAAWARRHARVTRLPDARNSKYGRPRHYLRAIAELAAQRGTKVHFLYMPVYGWPWPHMVHRTLYEDLGDVWMPPKEIFRDRGNWTDVMHLNRRGAALLSDWIVEKFLASTEP